MNGLNLIYTPNPGEAAIHTLPLCVGPCLDREIKQGNADSHMEKVRLDKNDKCHNFILQRYNKNIWGFGSDGYLYDFVKKRSPNNDIWGFGSDGYLYDFTKRSPNYRYLNEDNLVAPGSERHPSDFAKRSQGKRARNDNIWGFGSDGYLYDFVRR